MLDLIQQKKGRIVKCLYCLPAYVQKDLGEIYCGAAGCARTMKNASRATELTYDGAA